MAKLSIILLGIILAAVISIVVFQTKHTNKFLYNREISPTKLKSVNTVPIYKWPGPEYFKVQDYLIQDHLTQLIPKKTASKFELTVWSTTLNNILYKELDRDSLKKHKPSWIDSKEWSSFPNFLMRFIIISASISNKNNLQDGLLFHIQGKYNHENGKVGLSNIKIIISSSKNEKGKVAYAPITFDGRWLEILKKKKGASWKTSWQKVTDFDKLISLINNCNEQEILNLAKTSETLSTLFPLELPANINWSYKAIGERKLIGSREIKIRNTLLHCWEIGSVRFDDANSYVQRDFIAPGLGYVLSWTWSGLSSSQAKCIWLNRQIDNLIGVDAREMNMQCLNLLIIPKDKIFLRAGKGNVDPWKSWKLGKPLFDKKLIVNNN